MGAHSHPGELTGEHRVVVDGETNPAGIPALPQVRPAGAAGGGPVVAEHDGSSRNPLRAAEPKVRAATVAAVLTPVLLWLVHRYVPGAELFDAEIRVAVDGVATAVAVFVTGFLTRTVDRIDIWGREG